MHRLLLLLLTFSLVNAKAYSQKKTAPHYFLLIGTYDSPLSDGIYVYDFNSGNGTAEAVSHIPSSNPSYLAIAPNNKYVYAVNENADSITHRGGGVSAFRFDRKNGTLTLLGKQSSQGDHPCYVSVDASGKWVLAGNYSSGNFSVLPILKNGATGPAKTVMQLTGSGPDSNRQRSAHVHAVYFRKGTNELYVPDLGSDKLMCYRFNSANGTVQPSAGGHVALDPGTGPRHIDFHPNGKFAYLVEELTSNVVVLKKGKLGKWEPIQRQFALPPYYRGPANGADIHISADGKFLYYSNRANANTIAIFSVNPTTGMVTKADDVYTQGEKPRHFSIDPSGNYLLAGNQESNEVVIFKRDPFTGLLTDNGTRIKVGKPVCFKWIPRN